MLLLLLHYVVRDHEDPKTGREVPRIPFFNGNLKRRTSMGVGKKVQHSLELCRVWSRNARVLAKFVITEQVQHGLQPFKCREKKDMA